MAVRTKPFRIFESDIAPLRLIAELEQRSPQDVIHLALAKYIVDHRSQLSDVFDKTQTALADGDIDALSSLLSASARSRADELAKTLPSY
jgi:hypothetical protein